MLFASNKKMLRCKVCGYLVEDGKYDKCPACNVPASMFEPYSDPIPANRRFVLDLHIHPIIVHAPQGFTFLMMILAIGYPIVHAMGGTITEFDEYYIYTSLRVLSFVLPILIVASILSGLLDAHYRFKTVTASALVAKAVVGSIFLVLSVIMACIIFFTDYKTGLTSAILYALTTILAFACTVFLGIKGAALFTSGMGGPFKTKKKK